MDYINYVKQSPMMGQIGLGGGATSLGRYGSGGYATTGVNSGDRGLFGGGYNNYMSPTVTQISYININSTSNVSDFGDLNNTSNNGGGASDGSRGLFIGGYYQRTSQYVNIASTGNATMGGNWNAQGNSGARQGMGVWCDGGRVICMGDEGMYPTYISKRQMDYMQMQSLGNSKDFGDLAENHDRPTSTGDLTRGIVAGGQAPVGGAPPYRIARMDYVTIATKGDGTDFGDMTGGGGNGYQVQGGASNNTRGILAGGSCYPCSGNQSNEIQYLTVQTTGNTSDFGDLTQARSWLQGTDFNATRAVFAGGNDGSGYSAPCYGTVNTMDYITMASTGNASDFGDLQSCLNGLLGQISGST